MEGHKSESAPPLSTAERTEQLESWGRRVRESWADWMGTLPLSQEYKDLFTEVIANMPKVDSMEVIEGFGEAELMESYRNTIIDTLHNRMKRLEDQLVYETTSKIPANITNDERLAVQVYEGILASSSNKK